MIQFKLDDIIHLELINELRTVIDEKIVEPMNAIS